MLFDLSCQQTAFDLDKIVKQLEYQNNIWNHDKVADARLVDEKRKAYAMAIKIIKGGGLDNRDKNHVFEVNDMLLKGLSQYIHSLNLYHI